MKKTIAAVVMSAVAAVGSANAAIVFGNLGANGSNPLDSEGAGLSVTGSTWRAVGFQVASPNIYFNSASIGLAGEGVIELSLRSDAGGNPGSVLATSTASAPGDQALTLFSFLNPGSLTLNSGTNYWLVARGVSGGSATWMQTSVPVNPSGPLNGSGWSLIGGRSSTSTGASWSSSTAATSMSLSIDATSVPIPEPGTWAAMAILAGGAVFAGWRRRQQQLA